MKTFSCFKPRDPFRNWSKELDKRVAIWAKNFNSSFKLLLLGPAGAGKTTILKQMKIIHFEGFSQEERQQKAKEIRSNLLESVRELTACITASGHQIDWCDKENKHRLDFINGLNLDDQTYDLYAAKIYDYSKRILTDKGVEELFAKLSQLSITHRSQYLLNRVDEIRHANYVPNNDDILQSRRRTSDIQKLEFQVNLPVKSGQSIQQTFCMFDVGGQRGERRKWIQVFDGVSAVMFLIDSSSFDAIDDENGRNKLRETINLFHEVWTTRFLLNSNFVLLFNKQDILKAKIERGHKIEDHFPEYKLYKCPTHDRAYVNRAGEKLNLFRSTSRSSSRGSTSRSNSFGHEGDVALLGSVSGGVVGSQSMREKRKSSLYRMSLGGKYVLDMACGSGSSSTSSAPASPMTQATYTSASSNLQRSNPPLTKTRSRIDTSVTSSNHYGASHTRTPQKPSALSSSSTSDPNKSKDQQQTNSQQPSVGLKSSGPATIKTTSELIACEQAYIKARSFIRDKFLQVTRQVDNDRRKFSSASVMYGAKGCADQPKRNVYYHYTTATDTDNIRDLFENLQKIVIKATLKDLK